MATDAVVVDDLEVSFGATHALGGVDLCVAPSTTLGVLGHNGAGKTTLIRVLTTLIRPHRGRAHRRHRRASPSQARSAAASGSPASTPARRLPDHRREPRAGRPPGRAPHRGPGSGNATFSTA